MKAKLFTLFLAVMASVVTMRAEVLSGTCGEHLTWSLDTEDSTLTISGTGAMTNYSTSSLAPWIAHKDCIKSVVMEEGVTSIGEFAFYTCQGLNSVIFSHSITSIEWGAFTACTGLTSVIIGDAVTSIGAYAFDGCFNLTSVTISNSVTSIQGEAFWYCTNLKSISIGSAVTSISFLSFAYCTNLTSITCAAVTPPTCQTNTFNEVNKSIPLYVPSQSIPAYQAAEGWSEFTNILPIQGTEPCLLASGYCGADGDSTNLTWELSCDSILTITGAGKMADYASYSAPWRSYGTSSQIKRVIISEGVTSVGSYAFYQTFGLDSVYIPITVTSLGKYAFASCGITSIQLPNSITTIGTNVFSNCSFTNITIPSGIHEISENAFSGCHLSEIIIPDNITSIGNSAFSFTNIESVTIPASVTFIGQTAFSGERFREIHVDTANMTFSSIDGILFDKNKSTLLLYPAQREESEYIIPESVTKLGPWSFVNCKKLKSIVFPSNISELGDGSLYGCGLDSIMIIPQTISYIGDQAFDGCNQLKKLSISSNVTYIGSNAFSNCSSLELIICEAVVPPTLGGNGLNSFNSVDMTLPLYVPSSSIDAYKSAKGWNKFTNIRPILDSCMIASGTCGETLTWKLLCDGVLAIEGNGEMTSYRDSVAVPWYDYRRTDVRYIYISDNVTSIGTQAFMGCTLVSEIFLPDSVTSIGDYSFAGCSAMQSISIPTNVTHIGTHAFSGCDNLPVVGGLRYADAYLVGRADYFLNSYVVKEGTRWIGDAAFYGSSSRSVVIPKSVVYIADHAFGNCSQLETVYNLATTPQVISSNVFEYNNHTVDTLYVPLQSLELYQSADGWKEFANILPITYDLIPCVISSGTCGETLTWKFSCDSALFISGSGAMADYTSSSRAPWYENKSYIKTLSLLDSITSIGNYAFYNCTGLTSVSIPNSVTSIGEYAFRKCSGLTSVEIPNNVTSIGNYAFRECTGLTSIEIPNSVMSIGNYAFCDCSGLTSITCHIDIPLTIKSTVFRDVPTSIPLYVPAGSVDLYKAADQWKNFTNILPIEEPSVPPCLIASGYCGADGDSTNLRWELSCDSVLTISGTGDIMNRAWTGYSYGVKSVIIHEGVTGIGKDVFKEHKALEQVSIPNSIFTINEYAFKSCAALTSLAIPSNVYSIGNDAFRYCKQLTSITCEAETPPTLGTNVFGNINKSIPLYVPAESIELYKAADQWSDFTNILPIEKPIDPPCLIASGYCGAEGDSTNVRWELSCDSVLTISGIGAIKTANVTSDMTWYSNRDKIKSVIIENGVNGIGDKVFYNYSSLTFVTISNSVKNIGDKAFYQCYGLISADIPEGVTSIGGSSFFKCRMLASIDIPSSVTNIGEKAFYYCSGLTSITCHIDTPLTIDTYVFSGVNKSIPLYVPARSVELYKAANYWNEFTNILPIEEPVDPPCLIASGFCGADSLGTNLRWELSCDSVLTISGTGAMDSYSGTSVPWYEHRYAIRKVIIEKEVRSVANTNFNECINLNAYEVAEGNSKYFSIEGVLMSYYNMMSISPVNTIYLYPRGKQGPYVIPEDILSIGNCAFQNCTGLTSITISPNISSSGLPGAVGYSAFSGCTGLTEIICEALTPPFLVPLPSPFLNVDKTIPLYVPYESIAAYQTANIWKSFTNILPIPGTGPCLLASGYCGADSLGTNLRWELSCDSVLTISGTGEMYDYRDTMQVPWHAYRTQIRRVQMDNFTSIGSYAFYRFTNLESVVLPDSLQSIGRSAFEDSRVSSIAIPDGVRYIGDYAFNSCWKLDSLTVGRNVESIGYLAFGYPDNLKYFEWDAVDCNADTVFYVTEDMSEGIDYDQMFRMGAVKEIVFGESVRRIPAGLCSRMGDNYTSIRVVLPDSLQSIGRSAFEDSRVSSIAIPDGVRYIGDYAFNSCWKLDSLTVGRNVESIGYLAFGYPDNLKYFEWDAIDCNADTVFYVTEDMSEGIDYDQMFRMGAVKEIVFGESVRRIPAGLCSRMGDNYTSIRVVLPDSLQSIDRSAFEDSRVSSIAIPDGVRYIGDYAFNSCWKLDSLTVGRNVESIGYLAFGYPDNLKYFEWDAVDCNADTVFYVTEDMSEGISYDQMFRMGAVKEIVFGESVRRIPAGLCSRMGDNYTSIRVVLPDSLQSIGRSAFEDSRVSSIAIPDGVRYIGDYAFNNCWKLDSLTVGRNVEHLGYLAFGYPSVLRYFEWNAIDCNADTVFYIAEDPSEYSDGNYEPFRIGSVKTIVVGKDVRRIPDGLCSRMGGDHYSSIKDIVLPDSLVSIGSHAFEDCLLNSIVIPDGVQSIGDYAFNGCWTLNDITMKPMTPPAISGDSTYIFPDSSTIYVECPAVKAYRTAWPSYAHQIQSIGKEVKETFKARICYGDSVFFGGRSISQSGIYADTLVAYTGCDSIMELQLYMAPSYYFYDTISMNEGESYNWHGQTITTGGEHTQYYASSMDCDSVYVLFVNLIKMCSWKVESKDIVMGVVSTAFQANKYPYGTQLKVEALPNSGYKFVKWNDGKKYNPYTFTILDDKYLMAIFMEEEVEPDTTIVVPTVSTVTVTWPAVEDSYRYSLTIYLDEECTIPFCTVTFDAAGHVLDISFAQYGPRRVRKQDIGFTYTVPGLDANTKYYYRMEATDEDGKLLNTDEGDFQTKAGVPTSLDETETVIEPMKILHNGHVYILRADKVYTVTGVEIR